MAESLSGLFVFEWDVLPFVKGVQGVDMCHSFSRHMHDSFAIGMIDSGCRCMDVGARHIAVNAGELFVVYPNQSHSCHAADNQTHSYRVLNIHAGHAASCFTEISGSPWPFSQFLVQHIRDPFVAELLADCFEHFVSKRDGAACNYKLHMLMTELLVRHAGDLAAESEGRVNDDGIERVCSFISSHFEEDVSMARLASIACLSRFHMQRKFLRIKGVTPYEYLIKCRVDKARELLLSGLAPAAVAVQAGFADQSHFTRFFKRLVGIPPGRFQQLNS
ncbi:MAG TPA: AraC family transcriptional regulator [Deltaproteobacteria bacterium]|nr:AraC family transcriptional regulator [Deltaproteobacteria bacterium]HQB38333.1 AraC family transcriptional regulator [Deltaproteobacteria bacterium]